jgi:TonB-dependent starch-binding outer membrane protein SusC
MKAGIKTWLAAIFYVFLIPGLLAQENFISGRIISSTDGIGLPGVNILEKGTTNGTTSDTKGDYRLKLINAQSILVFSYIGYKTEEATVAGNSVLDISMTEEITSLEAVQVVGYGKIKKSDLTGAVSSVKGKDMKNMPVIGMDQALQGRAAGVMVTNNTGAPGSGVSIRIRGIGSIARSNEPLYIIDGIPIDNRQIGNPQTGENGDKINPMANINPDEIESIEVMKDPASCAIYGARGANGVVLINTKRGNKNGMQVEFSTYVGVSKVAKTLDLLDSKEYRTLVNEGLKKMRVPPASTRYISEEEAAKYNTNWQDEIFRTAPTYNASLSVGGGNENAQYMVNFGYLNTNGIVINTGFKRYSFRSNLDLKVSKNIMVGANLSFSQSNGQRQRNGGSANIEANKTTGGPIVMSALTSSPVYPVYDSLGNYGFDARNRAIANPVMLAQEQNLDYFTDRYLTSLYFDWTILKGLTFKSVLGQDIRNTKENFFWGPYYYPDDGLKMPGSSRTSDHNINGHSWVWTNTLNYEMEKGNHSLIILAGHEASKISNEGTYTEVGGMPIDGIKTFDSSPAKLGSVNYYSTSTLESYFGRVNYSYMGKYMLQVNLRADGSSRFGADNRWGFFPAASFGWNIAKENFMQRFSFINELKLRASLGVTGNQEVGDYAWRGAFMVGTIPNSYDVDNEVMNYLSALGGRYVSISDYGYSWEERRTINFGIDYAMLDNRIYLSAEYYKSISDNLLLEVSLPITTGIYSAWNNAGKLTNTGFEFTVTTHNTTGAFKWTTDFNIATNKLKVNKLITDSIHGGNTILIEGQGLNFYTYKRETYVDSLTGYVKLIDLNGDGQISYGGGDADKTVTGDPLPKFFGGITNTFRYKGFDLNIFFQFVYGNDLYNATRQSLEDLQLTPGLQVGMNSTREAFYNRYLSSDVKDAEGNVIYPRNIHTKYPTTNYSGSNIDQREGHNGWIEDGSYLRLKTLTFGYTLPAKILSKSRIRSARIYFSSNNLWTLTNYKGFDPEVSTVTGEGIGANLSIGIDAGAYPQSKTYTVGINVQF